MRCEEAREALWPQPLAGRAGGEALAHFDSCPACRQFFAVQGALGARLSRVTRSQPPATLRDRVAARLAAESAGTRRPLARRRARWLAGAGALAAAAVLVFLVASPDLPARVAQPLIQEAQRGATALALATDDHTHLQEWFEQRLGYAVHVPQIADAHLVGGRLTDLGGIEAATVLYRYHDASITYFALPTATVMGREVPEDRIVAASADGHELAVWMERGAARAVVAAMPRDDVMGFAIECRAKAMMSTT